MSGASLQRLLAYPWPGNVRELAHAVEHGGLVATGERLEPDDLPSRITGKVAGGAASHGLGGHG